MSDNVWNNGQAAPVTPGIPVDPAVVTQTIQTIEKILDGIGQMWGNPVYNNVLGGVEFVVNQPWFTQLLVTVIGMLGNGKSKAEIEEALKPKVAALLN